MKRTAGLACVILSGALSLSRGAMAAAEESAALQLSSFKAVTAELAGVNAAIKGAGAQWVAGDNPMMRLSLAQKRRRLGLNKPPASSASGAAALQVEAASYQSATPLPASLDWRNHNGKNYLTPVKDQGDCGSCWAFATTAELESYIMRTQNRSVDLSEQIVLSCSHAGNCETGGSQNLAAHFMKTTGVGLESAYRYTAKDGSCSKAAAGWKNNAYKTKGWSTVNILPNATAIKKALAAHGPVATSMLVYDDLYSYIGGIYSHVRGQLIGAHVVLIVGYDDARQCFIVKNSWGPGWGEKGYFRIAYSQMLSIVLFGADTVAFI